MDKKYNGFNNGRDKSEGIGGREVNHGTQETMTKDQIPKWVEDYYKADYKSSAGKAVKYLYEQLSAERERAGKLVGALNEYIVLLGEELDEVMGFVNSHQWKSTRFEKGEELRQKIKQTLNEYDTATKES